MSQCCGECKWVIGSWQDMRKCDYPVPFWMVVANPEVKVHAKLDGTDCPCFEEI